MFRKQNRMHTENPGRGRTRNGVVFFGVAKGTGGGRGLLLNEKWKWLSAQSAATADSKRGTGCVLKNSALKRRSTGKGVEGGGAQGRGTRAGPGRPNIRVHQK